MIERKFIQEALESKDFSENEKSRLSKYDKKVAKKLSKLGFKDRFGKRKFNLKGKLFKKNLEEKNSAAFILLSNKLVRDKILSASSEEALRGFWICKMFTKSSKFRLEPAPEPSMIIWKNIGCSYITRWMVYFIQFLVIFSIFLALLFVVHQLEGWISALIGGGSSSHSSDFEFGPFWSFILYFLIEFMFWLGKKIIYKISSYSLFLSKDLSSWNQATWLASIKLSSLMMLAYMAVGEKGTSIVGLNHRIVRVILNQIKYQAVLRILRLRHISKFFKMVKFWYSSRKNKIMVTQSHLNTIYEKPTCELEVMYSINMYVMMVMFCVSNFVPIVTLVCMLYFTTNVLIDRILFYWFYAEPSQKKQNLATRFFLSSGFLLKFWYINVFLGLTRLRNTVATDMNQEENLLFWIDVLWYFLIVIFFFPFGFVLRLEVNYLKESELRKRAYGVSSPKNKKKKKNESFSKSGEDLSQNMNGEVLEDNISERKLVEAFDHAYGYLDVKNHTLTTMSPTFMSVNFR